MRSNSIKDGNKSGNKNCNFAKIILMKAGILGGGQLGRMLLQAAANYTVETYVLENDPTALLHIYAIILYKAISLILTTYTLLEKK